METRLIRHEKLSKHELDRQGDTRAYITGKVTRKVTGHEPGMQTMQILAQERNTVKRKIIESLCIDSKAAHLCNNGLSTELPAIWKICSQKVAHQLSQTD